MDTQNKIDTLDETLRVIFLESAKDVNISASDKEMKLILFSSPNVLMTEDKKALLMQKLNALIASLSFGQLLQQAILNMNINDDAVAEKSNIPLSVIHDLRNDAIYTNNVPIVLFKNLLSVLNLSFTSVEAAIRKTFEVLQSQVAAKHNNLSGFSPAFRKGYYTSRETFSKNSPKSDGKELFENKEALEKYLTRLKELMNS